MSPSNLHSAWARLFAESLADAGVLDVVVSPGSRSTPLTLALAGADRLRVHVVVDERAAAFFALGQARVTGRPSAVLCTSGTAGAHYLPAVIEAHESYVPMVLVTADRPWEVQDVAASQTIDQRALFGSFVRHAFELGLPDPSPTALRAAQRIAAQATALALGPVPGPVHVNARFRKPLEPIAVAGAEAWEPKLAALLERGAPRVFASASQASEALIAELAERSSRALRGLIVAGPAPLSAERARRAVHELARATGFPVLAEAASQLRFGDAPTGVVEAPTFDAFVRGGLLAPDLVIEIGQPPTSVAYAALLEAHDAIERWVVAPFGHPDPSSSARVVVHADVADFAARLARAVRPSSERAPWAERVTSAEKLARVAVDRALESGELREPAIARALVRSCPDEAILVIGNSMPIRDLDLACPTSPRALGVVHQRGASGIDGLVAGAAGARSATDRPVALLLGDVSLRHDVGSLALAAEARGPLPIVVVNNGGGRIFDLLPIANASDEAARRAFERLFTTPGALDFNAVASGFGLAYARVTYASELERALAAAWSSTRAMLIEAVTEAGATARVYRGIWDEVRTGLARQSSERNDR